VDYREGYTKDIRMHVPETPDVVFHLGEYSRVEKSFEEPALVFDLNLTGTAAVLEFCREKKAKLLYAGSSTKFGDGGLGRDQSPYAFSKALNTELVKNYGVWYGLRYAITYFYNVYGPGERAGAYGTVIEIFRQKKLAGVPLPVNAPGTQKRNFTHVADIVDALVLIAERGEGDDYGIGDDRAYTILEVAELMGGEVAMQSEARGDRKDAELTTEKTRALGWKPQRSLKDYLHESTSA
jgi:UDP-glucose 4-epimerase